MCISKTSKEWKQKDLFQDFHPQVLLQDNFLNFCRVHLKLWTWLPRDQLRSNLMLWKRRKSREMYLESRYDGKRSPKWKMSFFVLQRKTVRKFSSRSHMRISIWCFQVPKVFLLFPNTVSHMFSSTSFFLTTKRSTMSGGEKKRNVKSRKSFPFNKFLKFNSEPPHHGLSFTLPRGWRRKSSIFFR